MKAIFTSTSLSNKYHRLTFAVDIVNGNHQRLETPPQAACQVKKEKMSQITG